MLWVPGQCKAAMKEKPTCRQAQVTECARQRQPHSTWTSSAIRPHIRGKPTPSLPGLRHTAQDQCTPTAGIDSKMHRRTAPLQQPEYRPKSDGGAVDPSLAECGSVALPGQPAGQLPATDYLLYCLQSPEEVALPAACLLHYLCSPAQPEA